MRLGHHDFNKTIDEYHKEIADIITNKETLILIDTNILAYLFKLHANARNEFFLWSNAVIKEERFFIPEWAANEYLNRVTTNKLSEYSHKSVNPKTAKKAYDALYEMASLFVDDQLLKGSGLPEDRDKYLDGFKTTIESLDQYTKPFKPQFKTGDVHNEIEKYFSGVVLQSDIASMCTRASNEGDARYEHRLPPGFKDGSKGENRFGDLIIWYEILEKSKETKDQFSNVLFLTNDEKSDWVYVPQKRAMCNGSNRKPVPNKDPDIRIADPRLVSEFAQKVGHSNLTICSLATLIESLSKNVDSTRFKNIAGAIQINIQESTSEPDDAQEGAPDAPEGGSDAPEGGSDTPEGGPDAPEGGPNAPEGGPDAPEGGPDAPEGGPDAPEDGPDAPEGELAGLELPYIYDLEALNDRDYQVDAPLKINEIIRALKSYNWYTQNPAILRIGSLVDSQFTPSSYFVLGRNVYQAACGNSVKAMDYVSSLSGRLNIFDDDIANHILSGMLFEIYFDSQGQFRNKSKFEFADKVLSLVTNDKYQDAKEFIKAKLAENRGQMLYLPGDTEDKTISIDFEAGEFGDEDFVLTSIKLDNAELIVDAEAPAHIFAWDYDLAGIKQEISESLAIPLWTLKFTKDKELPIGTFRIAAGKKLASMKDFTDS